MTTPNVSEGALARNPKAGPTSSRLSRLDEIVYDEREKLRPRIAPKFDKDESHFYGKPGKKYLRTFACKLFGYDDDDPLWEFRPSLLPELGERGTFTYTTGNWVSYMVCKMGKGDKVTKTTLLPIPDVYARIQVPPEFRETDANILKPGARFVWSQRALYDAKLLTVKHRLFRKLLPHQLESLKPWDAYARLAIGLALLQDLTLREVELFAGEWSIWWSPGLARSLGYGTRLRGRPGFTVERAEDVVYKMRQKLVKVGLIKFTGRGRETRYQVAPLGRNEEGITGQQLLELGM